MTKPSFRSLIHEAKSIAIIIHQQPDGDAVGSSVALHAALTQLCKRVSIVSLQDFPPVFGGIVGSVETRRSLPAVDLIIVVDCAELHRTGFAKQLQPAKTPLAVIDHHGVGDLAKVTKNMFCDPQAAATSEIVFDYLLELGSTITPPIATALLLGLYTDTGAFSHANTKSSTLKLASRLVRCGGDLPLIQGAFLRTFSPAKRKLWGKILSTLSINNYGVVTAVITKEMLQDCESSPADAGGLANLLALTSESKASLVLIEHADGWRGTLRTRHNQIDLGRLAKLLGGKGHKKAAGFTATKRVFSGKIDR